MGLKMFTCICDNGDDLEPVRVTGVATSMKDFKERYKGNGELLKIKEVETAVDNAGKEIFDRQLELVLRNASYGEHEITLILNILAENNK